MLPKVEGAIKNLFGNPSDAFYTGRVMDLLFDGVLVDCSSSDQIVGALCLTFEDTPAFRRVNDTHLAFSLFGGVSSKVHRRLFLRQRKKLEAIVFCLKVNGTDLGEMKVYRGKKNYKDMARLIAYKGDTGK